MNRLPSTRSCCLSQRGSSLVEVLFATVIVAVALVSLVSIITLVLKNQRVSADHQRATKYTQELVEWIRRVRDTAGWTDFIAAVTDGTLCVPAIPQTTTIEAYAALPSGECSGSTQAIAGTPFLRNMTMTTDGSSVVDVQVTVEWVEGRATLQSQTKAVIKKWN